MTAPYYATVEQLQAATDYKTTAYEQGRLARLLDAASRKIEKRLHRHFFPLTEAVTFIDPPTSTLRRVTTSGFWLDRDLLALTAATVDSTAQTVANVKTYPTSYGAPYSWIGLTGSTIVVTGRWGYSEDTTPAGAVAEEVDISETAINVSDSSLIGIGDLIKCESEQMLVTGKTQLDSAQNLGAGGLTASVADVTVDLTDGTAFNVGEIILIDSEKMLILDIAGNNGTVERAYDGTVLAAHAGGADIYAPRTLSVVRGAVGTTAATHVDTTALVKNVPPAPVTELCIAEAVTAYEQEASGYGRTIGSGDSVREARGAGLRGLQMTVADSYRRVRTPSL